MDQTTAKIILNEVEITLQSHEILSRRNSNVTISINWRRKKEKKDKFANETLQRKRLRNSLTMEKHWFAEKRGKVHNRVNVQRMHVVFFFFRINVSPFSAELSWPIAASEIDRFRIH